MPTATKVKLRPLHDRILVKRLEEKEEQPRQHHHPRFREGEAPGGQGHRRGHGKVTDEGKKLPLDVKAGDRILFGKYSGSEVKIDGDEYLILREEDVLGILD